MAFTNNKQIVKNQDKEFFTRIEHTITLLDKKKEDKCKINCMMRKNGILQIWQFDIERKDNSFRDDILMIAADPGFEKF